MTRRSDPGKRKHKHRVKAFGSCNGKTRYRDKAEATRSMHGIANGSGRHARVREVSPVRAYECPACRGWHLTSRR